MAMQDPKELFVKLLSDVRQNEEKTTNILQELSDAVDDPEIKEAIESRIFLKNQTISTLDRCFELIGERPQGFVQVDFAPPGYVPAQVAEDIDYDGDGQPDFRLELDTQTRQAQLTPYSASVIGVQGVFRLKDAWAVRVGVKTRIVDALSPIRRGS